MNLGDAHSDVYDRESDYWKDLEDIKNGPSSAATDKEHENKIDITSIAQDSKIRTVEGK